MIQLILHFNILRNKVLFNRFIMIYFPALYATHHYIRRRFIDAKELFPQK